MNIQEAKIVLQDFVDNSGSDEMTEFCQLLLQISDYSASDEFELAVENEIIGTADFINNNFDIVETEKEVTRLVKVKEYVFKR